MIQPPAFDIDKARNDTPGCKEVIHLNNAGSSLPPNQMLDTMLSHFKLEATIGGYEAARLKHESISAFYNSVAALINARPDEIAFTDSATRAWDMAFYSMPFKPGDKILISGTEYLSNSLAYSQVARNKRTTVEVIPDDDEGQVSVTALENMIDDKVKLIAVTHVPTNSGLVQPAAAVGKIARKAGIVFLLDSCQSVGQMPIDVNEIGCDLLSATGRKYLRGPRGTGFLYARKEILEQLEPPFLDMHTAKWTGIDSYEIRPDAKRFEQWESNIALKLGLGTAVDYAMDIGISNTYPYIRALAAELRHLLHGIKKVKVYDRGAELCGIVTFTVENKSSLELRDQLMKVRINVSITDAMRYYWKDDAPPMPSMIRASVHYYNTTEEIHRFADVISQI